MANQLENSDLIIQLPWTVPQQPNVQTIVLQQPAKTHMELNASTDKTAISSFALSVVFALILGGLATWLAYWYGRKSFDLTKQSFDAVIAQINTSMLEAKNNKDSTIEQINLSKQEAENNKEIIISQINNATKATIDSNMHLADVQIQAKLCEIRAQRRLQAIDNLQSHFSSYLALQEHLVFKANDFASKFFCHNGHDDPMEYSETTWVSAALNELLENRLKVKEALEKSIITLDLTDSDQNSLNTFALNTMKNVDEIVNKCRNIKDLSQDLNDRYISDLDALRSALKKFLSAELVKALKGE